MGKKTKDHKPLTRQAEDLRERIAENISLLMENRFQPPRYRNASARERALAKAAGVSWSTIQRALAPVKARALQKQKTLDETDLPQQVSLKTDTLADLAAVFEVSPSDLLTPNFAQSYIRAQLQRRSG